MCVGLSREDEAAAVGELTVAAGITPSGVVHIGNFREVIKACMRENGMDFDEEELNNLASALFQDGVKDGQDHMDLDDFNVSGQLASNE